MAQGWLGKARTELAERLCARRGEIEEATLTRTYAIADPSETANPEYAEGLRAAVSAALDYGLAAVEHGEERDPPVPVLLLAQARLAARNGVPLDTVLRRYFAGYTLFGDFIVQEVTDGELLGDAALRRLLRSQAALFDRLIATVTDEHGRESGARAGASEERRLQLVKRLLDGELVADADLEYDLDIRHIGVVGTGPGTLDAVRELATRLDRRLLSVRRDAETVWAWLGSPRPFCIEDLARLAGSTCPTGTTLAIGEPAEGRSGWRLTHRQARAALPIALRSGEALTRYTDVALLASVLQDDLLVASLHQIYLMSLSAERDGGKALRETLRMYFGAGRSVSSAAAALKVNRHTVTNRLRIVEQRLGRTLQSCGTDIEVALRLDELDDIPPKP